LPEWFEGVHRVSTDALFGPDGTQDPLPPPVFPDPLSGLVTGESWVAESYVAE
jgi:hypothetical protein